ncbi:MAG: glycosyltransferase family 2 protein [Anaerolinea sp.]|nr:glycosyltransferase family 2 protein [Anaerolinea sp.]
MSPLSLSIVIPVYKGAQSLPELIDELKRVLPTLTDQYEAILVDDGSPDHSWQVIEHLAAQHPWVRGITLMRNYGQHNALLCGIRSARYEVIITMDDDLQHPPAQIPTLLAALTDQVDVVYGAPERERHGLLRDLASQITKLVLQGSMGVQIAREVSAFRAFRTILRDAFASYTNPYVSIDVLLTWGTRRFAAVRVPHAQRKYGQSNYTLRKLITHALNMITGFSTLPLQVASLIGFALALFGVLVLIYVIGRALIEGVVVPGFAFLASVIAIFSGAQLFALGIIGEYLARIHSRAMERPVYTIRASTESPAE